MSVSDPTDALRERAQSGDAQALYLIGRTHAARQEFTRARRAFREAGARGHPEALAELALFALFGIGEPEDLPRARELLLEAEAAGSGEAAYQLALIAWTDGLVPFDVRSMATRLLQAARQDFAPALRALFLVYRRMGETALASACIARAAALGDPVASMLHGRALLEAGERNVAKHVLTRAAQAGRQRAQELLTTLEDVEPEAPNTAAIPELPPPRLEHAPGAPAHCHCESPPVETVDGVFDAVECDYIIAHGDGKLQRSKTVDDASAALLQHEYRTSSDHSIFSFEEDFGLRWLQWRMLRLIDVGVEKAEPMVLLRYERGQEYRPHRDYLPPGVVGRRRDPSQPGQRVHTVFAYLCDVEAGGGTDFPLLGVRIEPRLGRVVHFVNLTPDGDVDPRTLHAGLPVERGTKWLATLWTRERRVRDY